MDTSGTTAPEIVPILQDDRRLGVYLKKLEGIERQNERRLFSVYSPSGLEFQPRGSSLYSQSPRSHPISKQTAEEGTDGRLPPIRDILGMYLRSGDNLVSPDPYSDARHHSTSEQVCSRPAVCTSSGPNPFADALKCHEPGCMAGPLSTTYGLRSHLIVHLKERLYICPREGCQRRFKRENEMKGHMLVHSPPGYICPYCANQHHRYKRLDNLQRHISDYHPGKGRIPRQVRPQQHTAEIRRGLKED